MVRTLLAVWLGGAAVLGTLLYVVAGGHDWTHRWQAPIRFAQCCAAGLAWPAIVVVALLDRLDWRCYRG